MERSETGVRLRARLLGMRVPEPWLDWAEQDVRAPTWPIWRGLAVTLWGAGRVVLFFAPWRLMLPGQRWGLTVQEDHHGVRC